MNIKIGRAKQMLVNSHNNISEIAEYLGFLDIQHFSKVFKKKTGMTPTEYRAKCPKYQCPLLVSPAYLPLDDCKKYRNTSK